MSAGVHTRLDTVEWRLGTVSAKNVPPYRPRLVVKYSASDSDLIACRTVSLPTPSLLASSRSGGRASPGSYTPSHTSCNSRLTVDGAQLNLPSSAH